MHRNVAGFGSLLPVHWELSLRNQGYLARFLELLHSLPHHSVAAAGLSLRDGVLLLRATCFYLLFSHAQECSWLWSAASCGLGAFIEELNFGLVVTGCLIPTPPPNHFVATCYRRGGCGAFIEGSNLLCMELFFLFLPRVGCRASAYPLCATGAFIEGSTFRLVVTDC